MNLNNLTPSEQEELIYLLEQKELEKVSPKMEAFRDPCIGGTCDVEHIRIKGARGGRGSLAKSHSMVSLLVQMANVKVLNIACFREIMMSIQESVYKLIKEKVEFLRYKGWIFKQASIEGPLINGKRSHFIFRGLKDTRSATNIKSLEAYDIMFIEECSDVSLESLTLLLPTLLRRDGAQFWFCYNPNLEDDPITVKVWNAHREDALLIEGKPGREDNPWFNDAMVEEMERDKKADYENYLHVWCGEPYNMGESAILSRADVHDAMDRNLPEPQGLPIIVGADIARYGSDRTCIIARKGNKVIDIQVGKKWDTMYTAKKCFEMGRMDPTSVYNIDAGAMGPGVIDKLRELGATHVNEINFGAAAINDKKYVNKASEMWFNLKSLIKEIDIPNNQDLKDELCSRQYSYDNKGRNIVESKEDYKKRKSGISPDLADGLLLCFYGTNNGTKFNSSFREAMRKRRGL